MKNSFIKNTLWAFFGQFGYMLLGLAGNIILARLLNPTDFGQLGILMFFVLISSVLVESGFSGALIRKNDVTEDDYSTIFVFNLLVSLALYALLFIFSDSISTFYNDSSLKNMLYVIGAVLIFNAFQITQNAKLVKEMRFKERSLYKFISLLLATIISVILAYNGFGVWALIFLQVLSSLFLTIILMIKIKNSFKFKFNKASFKEMYAFGVNTTLASVINTGFENCYQLILGKYFSINQVGIYYQAKKLQDVPDTLYKNVILNVFFAHLTKYQHDVVLFKKKHLELTVYTTVIIGISTLLISSFSKEIIVLFYGKKWIDSAFFLQLLAIASFFYLIEILNRNIFKIFNETRKILFLEIVKKIIQSITIFIGIYFRSIEYLLVGYIATAFFSLIINYYYSSKIIKGIDLKELKSLFFVLSLIIILYTVITMINNNIEVNYFILSLEIIITISLYSLLILKFNIIKLNDLKKIIFKRK